MRRLTPVEIMLVVFWLGYTIIAACVVYEAAQPVGRVLLVILGGYSIALAPMVIAVLWHSGRHVPEDGTTS